MLSQRSPYVAIAIMSLPEELAANLIILTVRVCTYAYLPCISFTNPYKLLEREAEAVKEWLSENKTFHVLRDHPHHTAPIMGGLWGARWDHVGAPARHSLVALRDAIMRVARGKFRKGADQPMLWVS